MRPNLSLSAANDHSLNPTEIAPATSHYPCPSDNRLGDNSFQLEVAS